ncbi:MAG: hypothetical protein LBD20_07960, partial [Spirochaetaceae bacterium]|nr:hypothetical protein [Spirochaetaceae bacterium]
MGMVFAIIGSLRPILDDFMRGRISFIETELAQLFPDSNILETRIETHELAAVVDTVRQTADAVNTSRDGFLEKIIFKVFLNKLTGYISAAESGINTMKIMTNENGAVTIKSILFGVKDLTLETVSPYFIFGQIGVLVLLLLFIGIYVGIAVYLIKGGAMYNKSIVFGNITGNKSA